MIIYKVSLEYKHSSIEGWVSSQDDYYSSIEAIIEDCQDLNSEQKKEILNMDKELSIEYSYGERLYIKKILVKT